jgi:hypothetical protein
MKTKISLMFIIAVVMFGCEKDNNKSQQLTITGKYLSHSECKSGLKSAVETIETPDTLSCIEYSFNESTNKLSIKHVNAGFNCCPDTMFCLISVKQDTIIIEEKEQGGMCNCDCIYDLNMELSGVAAKKYQVKVIEPYLGDQEAINFELDLANENVSSYCATRKQYPWGTKIYTR